VWITASAGTAHPSRKTRIITRTTPCIWQPLGRESRPLAVGCLIYKHTSAKCKTSPGPPRGVMVSMVPLVHPDPPWSTFSLKSQKVWIRMDRRGPGGPRGPQPPMVDQECSGPPWTTLRHFSDASNFILHGKILLMNFQLSPSHYTFSKIFVPRISCFSQEASRAETAKAR